MAVSNFNLIAPFYDRLARLIFRKALLDAQLVHIGEIGENDQVLILGGGTGEILEHLPLCENINYVEKSHQMIRRAKRRLVNQPVNFIQEDFLNFHSERKYDVIICPFFLDCFDEENLLIVLKKCKQHLLGKMIVVDFTENSSNNWMVRFMHVFFRVTSNLESKRLKNIHKHVVSAGLQLIDEKFLHQNLLFSRLYRNL